MFKSGLTPSRMACATISGSYRDVLPPVSMAVQRHVMLDAMASGAMDSRLVFHASRFYCTSLALRAMKTVKLVRRNDLEAVSQVQESPVTEKGPDIAGVGHGVYPQRCRVVVSLLVPDAGRVDKR